MIWLRRGLAALLLLILLTLGGGWLLLRSSLPDSRGEIAVPGLGAPVEIERDADGLVIIRAASEADGYFGLGFAHAQDRLFQMEMMRRFGAGRLSEVVGAATAALDRTMRVLGLYRLAEANFDLLLPEVRSAIEAYAAGVNAFLEKRGGLLPPEFLLLRHEPEPWRPADSLVWGRLMALQLSGNWREEALRHRLAERLTTAQLEALWPSAPEEVPADGRGGAALSSEEAAMLAGLPLPELPPSPLLARPRGASNNWVAAGSRTESGAPLLAADLHLGLQIPIQWYLARIETPDHLILGATAPGVPFHIVGQTRDVAWGLTTTHSDTQDLFVEKLAGADDAAYETPAGPQPFAIRREAIRIRDAPPIELLVRESVHGPIVSDIGYAAPLAGRDRVVALAWTGLRADDLTAQALYRMNRAGSVAEFREALRDFHSPQQNIVFADRTGSIAFMAPGRVPIRKDTIAASQMPVPGWTGAYEWAGFIPFEELPQSVDPPLGWLGSANNRIVGPDYPHLIAARWPDENRMRRIGELLDGLEPLDIDRMAAMQMDVLSVAARELVPRLLADLATARPALAGAELAAADLLGRWDFRMDRDRPEPLIYAAWLAALNEVLLGEPLGPLYGEYVPWNLERVGTLLAEGPPGWCDDPATPDMESCAARVAAAFATAIAGLIAAHGDEPPAWRWAAAHRARFPHAVLGRIPLLGDLFQPELATDGGNDTLNRGAYRLDEAPALFPHVHGAGLRAVFDLAEPDASRFVIAGGQSGNPLSRHFADLIPRWRDGGFVTIVGEGGRVLTLTPE